jgi:hypothetical protein
MRNLKEINEDFPLLEDLDNWVPVDIIEDGVLARKFEEKLIAYRIFPKEGIWSKIYDLIQEKKDVWTKLEGEAQRKESTAFMAKQTTEKIKKDEEHGPKLLHYEELAKPGEPLPDKYYKFHSDVKDPKFVLQRHYPTGKKVPIKPGEEEPQIHKSFVVEYDEKHPEALTGLMSDLIDQYEELDEKERVKIEKSTFGVLFEGLVVKIRDHLDLRMEISDSKLVGVTIHPPVPGGITAWDAFKSRMTGEEKTQVTPKFEHPHPWLTREGELRFPTRHKEPQEAHYLEVARMDIIDTGPVKFGVQREDLHEFFFYGKILKGRWVIRKLKIGTEAAHWAWLLMKPSDQRPLDPVLHRDSGHIEIDRVSQPTTEEREHIEEETQAARAERGQEI